MFEKDVITKDYTKECDVFADAFNQYIYKGQQVIKPENLKPHDTLLTGVPYDADGASVPEELEKKPDSGEYLSGFYREDRLIPVITLIMYFAPGEWDGPRSLHEMLAVQDPEILSFVSDYKLNLIAPGHMSDAEIGRFSTSLREVMLFIKYSKDKARLNEMVQKDDRFRNMDRKAAAVVSTVTGVEIAEDYEEDKVDMCQALREMTEDATNEGLTQVARRMLEEGSFSIELIAKMTGLSVEAVYTLQV